MTKMSHIVSRVQYVSKETSHFLLQLPLLLKYDTVVSIGIEIDDVLASTYV